MEDNPIEIEFQLRLIKSQRGNEIIIEGNKHIYYYSHTRKDNSKVYKCSVDKGKIKCYEYIVMDTNNNFNQEDYNLTHTEHDEKQNEIQTLLENNTMKDIINKSYNKFTLKPTPIINEVFNWIGSINPKYNNVRHNLYNQFKKLIPKDPIDINSINREDDKFLDINGENILIYKDLNILVFTNSKLIKIAYENNNDVFLDATFQTVNKLYKQLLIIRIYSERFNYIKGAWTVFYHFLKKKIILIIIL